MIYSPLPIRRTCRSCGVTFNYHELVKHRKMREGVDSICLACNRAKVHKWADEHPDELAEGKRRWAKNNPEKKKNSANKYARANKEKISIYAKQYYSENIDDIRRKSHEYNQEHYWSNPDYYREIAKLRARERYAIYGSNYIAERDLVYIHNRLAKKKALPNTFTEEQWIFCLSYFNYCCAACGDDIDMCKQTKRKLAIDHWIPLQPRNWIPDYNPGTVAENIVPLCHGIDGCNNNKSTRNPIEWLESRFGKERAGEILMDISNYFEWIKNKTST